VAGILSDHVLTVVTAVGTFLAAVAAWVAAVAARRSAFLSQQANQVAANTAQVTANASQAALYLRFQQQYAGDEMWRDLRNLRSWKEMPHGEDFASKWARLYRENDDKALAVDRSRRRVSHFFDAIAVLYEKHLVSEDIAKLLTRFQGIDLFFEVVEPLEKALNEDYDKSSFDILYALRPTSGLGLGQPRWFRPVIVAPSSTPKNEGSIASNLSAGDAP
jgi:hypothetical protein